MGHKRILLAVSVFLSALGIAALASGIAPAPVTVQLSSGSPISLPDGPVADDTTTTGVPETTTTSAVAIMSTTTSTIALSATTTSSPSTTVPQDNIVIEQIVN